MEYLAITFMHEEYILYMCVMQVYQISCLHHFNLDGGGPSGSAGPGGPCSPGLPGYPGSPLYFRQQDTCGSKFVTEVVLDIVYSTVQPTHV